MNEKDNYLINAELSTEQNENIIDGILNNTPPVTVPLSDNKPLDRVKPPTEKKRCRERER